MIDLLDELEIDRAHLIGNSLGGRVALEIGLRRPTESSGWRCSPRRSRGVRAPLDADAPVDAARARPGPAGPAAAVTAIVNRLIPGAGDGWAAAGVDEFLRAYLTPAGRAAFYGAARQIYLEEPHGERGFWPRLKTLRPDALFVWGRRDKLVPLAFARHVSDALPRARAPRADCGHVPQVERPRRPTPPSRASTRAPRSCICRMHPIDFSEIMPVDAFHPPASRGQARLEADTTTSVAGRPT